MLNAFRTLSRRSLFQIIVRTVRVDWHVSSLSLSSHCSNMEPSIRLKYPEVRRDETCIEELHGVKVSDPYRWLEDGDSEETAQFVANQNDLAVPFLDACPVKDDINKRLKELHNYPRYSCPFKRGSNYFYYHNTGLQNLSVLYIQRGLDAEPSIFFDPNALSEDGTVAIKIQSFSEDGRLFAYGLSSSGSDWIKIQIRDVESGKDFPEVLDKVKYSSISWTHDHKGFFYNRYPEQKGVTDGSEITGHENQKMYYHRVDTDQDKDVKVVEFLDRPKWLLGKSVSDCGRYLIVNLSESCQDNLVYFADLSSLGDINGLIELKCIVDVLEADYEYVTNTGSLCIFRTNKDAPNYRLIIIDLNDYDRSKWKTLIPEQEKDVLDWAECVADDKLVICYLRDVKNVMELHDLHTGELIFDFPLDVGSITGFSGRKDQKEIFYSFSSFLTPSTIFHCDLTTLPPEPKIFRETKLPNFDTSQYTTSQIFYPSKDGTKIPMFILHRKDLVLDGSSACILYGYGGFNISVQPSFSSSRIAFLQNFQGVYAVANIRGGGEYGENWHNAGRLLNRQNSFDDFQAAAQFLFDNGYTNKSKLAISGGSQGGFLVTACCNQRPDLFAACICQVGVLDLLRFHKFTVGSVWCSDYGNPDEEKYFKHNLKLSPLHNVPIDSINGQIQYPAILLLTADHDDRVSPLHSFKFVAELQNRLGSNPNQTNPLLMKIETKAGHGAGKPMTKVIDESTNIYCFLMQVLKLKFLS